jgi:hypothetical protein
MKITARFKAGHTVEREYVHCELFCPNCCKQMVWEEQGEGDYYLGNDYICIGCSVSFTIQGPYKIEETNESEQQFLQAIINSETE